MYRKVLSHFETKQGNIFLFCSFKCVFMWVFRLEEFENMTCFDIAHSNECIGLWKETASDVRSEKRQDKNGKAKSYTVMRSHPIFKRLRVLYGLPTVETRKRCREPEEETPEEDKMNDDYV